MSQDSVISISSEEEMIGQGRESLPIAKQVKYSLTEWLSEAEYLSIRNRCEDLMNRTRYFN